jgi:hypothetical protein
MTTKPLSVLVCGGDIQRLRKIAQVLADEAVKVKISTRIIDYLCFSQQEWDILLIDLDGLNSFLSSLLPAIRRRFSKLYMVGITSKAAPDVELSYYGLTLDDYVLNLPRAEDLIVRFPGVTASYLCDTGALPTPAGAAY